MMVDRRTLLQDVDIGVNWCKAYYVLLTIYWPIPIIFMSCTVRDDLSEQTILKSSHR